MYPLSLLLLASILFTIAGCTYSLASFLAKTSETFKLADLQYAEARLQAASHNFSVSRLLIDRSTGSMLLELDHISTDLADQTACNTMNDGNRLPSSLSRCDWILEILNSADTGEGLVNSLRKVDKEKWKIKEGWVLDYLRFEDAQAQAPHVTTTDQGYTMRSLLCSVAQALPTIPALDPKYRSSTLLLVDTRSAAGDRIFLGRLCRSRTFDQPSSTSILASRWSQRPFQYSSAINKKAAEIIMDWLCDAVAATGCAGRPLLLDPTCGSGTFLALGVQRGLQVEGCDINPSCVEGSRCNLVHMFGEEKVHACVNMRCLDSGDMTSYVMNDKPACVVSNLPWGINTAEYVDENLRILQSIHNLLSKGTPCVFVTKNAESKLFDETGFQVLAQAHVPPLGFKLPKSKKKEDLEDTDTRNGRNSCVITFASSR